MARIKKSKSSRPRCWFRRQPFPSSPSPKRHSNLPSISVPRSSSTRPQLFSAVKLPICRCLFIRHLEGCFRHDAHILRMHKDHPDPPEGLRRSKLDCNCNSAFDTKEEDGDELHFPDLVMKETEKSKRLDGQRAALGGKICTTVSWSSPANGNRESEDPMADEMLSDLGDVSNENSGNLQAEEDISSLDRNNGGCSQDDDWRILLENIEASDRGEGFERSSDEISNGGEGWGFSESGEENSDDGGDMFGGSDCDEFSSDDDGSSDEESSGGSSDEDDNSESSSEDDQEHGQVRFERVTTVNKSGTTPTTFTGRAAAGQNGESSGSSRSSRSGHSSHHYDMEPQNGNHHRHTQVGRNLWYPSSSWERGHQPQQPTRMI